MACWNGNSLATSEDPQLMHRLCNKHKVNTADVTPLYQVVSENLSRKQSVLVSAYPLPIRICLLEYFIDLIVKNSNSLVFLHTSGFYPEFLRSLDISSTGLFEEFLDRKKTFDKFKRVYLVVHQDYYNLNNTDTLVNNNNVVFVFISNHVLSPFLMPGVKNALNLILCPEILPRKISPFSYTHIRTDGKDVLVEMCVGRPNEIVSRIRSNKKVESLISRLGERELPETLPQIMSDELLNSLIQKYLVLDFELLENISEVVASNLFKGMSLVVERFDAEILTCLLDYLLMKLLDTKDACVLVYYVSSVFKHILKLDVLLESGNFSFVTNENDFSKKILFCSAKDVSQIFLGDKFRNSPKCYIICFSQGGYVNKSIFTFQCPFLFLTTQKMAQSVTSGISRPFLLINKEAFSSRLSLTPINGFKNFTDTTTNTVENNSIKTTVEKETTNMVKHKTFVSEKVDKIPKKYSESLTVQAVNRVQSFNLSSLDSVRNSCLTKKLCSAVLHFLNEGDSIIVHNFDHDILACLFEYVVAKKSVDSQIYYQLFSITSLNFDIIKSVKVKDASGSKKTNLQPFHRNSLYIQFYISIHILKNIFSKNGCQVLGLARSDLSYYCNSKWISSNFVNIRFVRDEEFVISHYNVGEIYEMKLEDSTTNTVENDSTKTTVEKETTNTVKHDTSVSDKADKIPNICSESLTLPTTDGAQSFNLSSLDNARISRLAKKFKTNPVAVGKLCSAVLHFLNEGDSIIVDNFDHDILACLFEYVVTKKSVDSQIYYRFINLQSQNIDIVQSVNVQDVSDSELKNLQPFNRNSLHIQFYISLHFLENIFSKIGCQVLGLARSDLSYYCNSKWISSPFVNIRFVRGEEFVINHCNVGEIPAKFEPVNTQDREELSELSELIINKRNPVKIMINKLFTEHNIPQPSFSSSDSYLCILTFLLENRSLVLEGYCVIFLTPLIRVFALESQKYDRNVYIYNCSEFYDPSIPKSKIITKEYFLQHDSVNDVTLRLFLLFFVDSKDFSEIQLHLSKHHQYVFVLSEAIASSSLENSALDFTHVSNISDSVCIREYRRSENNSPEALGPYESIPEIEQPDSSPKLPDSDIVMQPASTEMDSNQENIPEVPLESIESADKTNETRIEENIELEFTGVEEDPLLETENYEDYALSGMQDIPENEVAVDNESNMNIELNSGSDESVENAEKVTENVKFEEIPESERFRCLQQKTEIIHSNLDTFELDSSKLEFPNSQSETKEFRREKPINQMSDDNYQSCDSDEISHSTTQLPSTNELSDSKDSQSLPKSKTEFLTPDEGQDNSISISENSISVPEEVSDTNLNSDLSDSSIELIASLLNSGIHLIIQSSSDLLYIPILQYVASVLKPSAPHLQVVLTSDSPQICSTLFKLLSTKLATLEPGFLYKTGQILKLQSYIKEKNVQILSIPLDSLVSLIQQTSSFLENSLLVYIEDNAANRDNHGFEILLKKVSKQYIFLLQNESFSPKASHFPTPFFEVKQASQDRKSRECFCVEFNSD